MGNTQDRVVQGVDQVIGVLAGAEMLTELKRSMLTQKPFRTMFGEQGERFFIEQVPAYNETILPCIEFQPISDFVQGGRLRQNGIINCRVLFPNNLTGLFKIYRLVAMVIARYFTSQFAVDDFVRKVPGLIEFGENMDYRYQSVYNIGEMTIPALIIQIPYIIDLNRMRAEDGCTDLDGNLDDKLLAEIETYFLTITDDKEVVEDRTILLDKQPLPVK